MQVYKSYIDAYPVLKNYSTFDGAFSQIQDNVPSNFWNEDRSPGQKVEEGVMIFSSLGIAYLMELQKKGVKLMEPEKWQPPNIDLD